MSKTPVLSIQDPQAIPTAKDIIAKNGLIVFPTDTIYGVAARVSSPEGILRIFSAKERPTDKALPVLIGSLDQIDDLAAYISDPVRCITEVFWPGALTLILPKSEKIPSALSPYPTVGIRMPDLPFTLSLLKATGALATTSANISGGPNPTSAQDALAQLDGRVDLILDGGPTPGPTASTVLDVSGPTLKVLREGPISFREIEAIYNQA